MLYSELRKWGTLPTDRFRTDEDSNWSVRQLNRVKYSRAYIVLPGGPGTLDELFELATLLQCGKVGPFPLALVGREFWRGMRDFLLFMVQQGVFVSEDVGFAPYGLGSGSGGSGLPELAGFRRVVCFGRVRNESIL